jgi:three-Cys-motif partner protein
MQSPDRAGDAADFFDELRSWSRIKLRILEKYLRAYLNKRGSSKPTIYYLDGFAGQGYYGDEGQDAEDGSPLRIARLAQEIKDEAKPYRLICLNTELGKKRCGDLRKVLAGFDPELVQVYCGAFAGHLPRILGIMGRAPAVCFLDPCGVVGISPAELQPLLERRDTEILLNLSTPTLHRLAGFANSTAKEAPGKVAQLSHILGDDPGDPLPEWLHMRNTLSSSDEWEEWAVQRYLELMRKAGPHLKYGLAYPVRPKHGGGVKYYLVFATRSMDAFPIMTDLICTEEDDLALQAEIASRPLGQVSMFGPVHVSKRQERYTAVIEEIHAFGLANQGVNRTDLIQEFSYRYLGEFRQKDFRFMVEQLVRVQRAEFGQGSVLTVPIRFR